MVEYKKDGFIGQRMVYLPGIVKKKVLKDPRVFDAYITHIGIFPNALGHLRERPLGCRQFILLYCSEGVGWVETEGKRQVISKDELVIIEPKTPNRYGSSSDKPWTVYWVHYSGENARLYSPQLNRVVKIPFANNSRIEERLMLFEEMLQNAQYCFNSDKVVYANICLKQFLSSIKFLDVYRSVKTAPEETKISQAIAFMKNNLHNHISVADIAKMCNCSTSNIYRLFKMNMNSSPQDFFIHLKMERARKYLVQTNFKVKEIAAKLGYDDPYYFSRIFKIHVGQSPANYRKEER